MKIALLQTNPTVGDLEGNAGRVAEAARRAHAAGAELAVTSELVVSGYPPKDLLLRDGFVAACERTVSALARAIPADLPLLVGHPAAARPGTRWLVNAASLLRAGGVQQTIRKWLLPNYDVFDERRYFLPGEQVRVMECRGRRLGVHICEDAWWGEPSTSYRDEPDPRGDPVAELARQGAEVLINLSASPFEADKPPRRQRIGRHHVAQHGVPYVFVNQVGGNDDLVFDGHSYVLDARGRALATLAGFAPDMQVVDLAGPPRESEPAPRPRAADLLDALILGLRDYAWKSGFRDCVLGLSGGIDSALAAYIGARALGPERVHGLALPSRYSSEHSVADALALARNLGIACDVIPIDPVHRAYEQLPLIGSDLASQPQGIADQNLQARIRGALVMERSNRHGWLALATGNKSELAVGYCTLYGDMCGGFAVLSDIFKRDVYAIAQYINDVREGGEVIPRSSLTKAPSAELAPNQFDQDTLPPYPVLDGILEGLVEQELGVEVLAQRYPRETVEWVVQRLDRNEFKRRQMPPGIKLSQRAFGSGRRMPIAARFPLV